MSKYLAELQNLCAGTNSFAIIHNILNVVNEFLSRRLLKAGKLASNEAPKGPQIAVSRSAVAIFNPSPLKAAYYLL